MLRSLPSDAKGQALIEIPSDADRQDLKTPKAVTVEWLPRSPNTRPGTLALEAATALPTPATPFYAWTVGESTLPTTLRRHWLTTGVPKQNIMFCGYWKNTH
ncbi:siderophore-interacting protein [Actinocorallia sp. API 0066]|nr:siderophore-interacting protein [Actinocorallia sp. API 0066]